MAQIQKYFEAQTQHFNEQLALSQAAQREEVRQQLNAFAAQFSTQASSSPVHPSSAASLAASTARSPVNPLLASGPLASSNPLPTKVKIAAPSTFNGMNDQINVDVWLFEMVQYLDTTGVAENLRISVVRNYLKQAASTWWVSLCKANKQPLTWDAFVESIKLRFQPIEAGRIARSHLHSIHQDRLSVAEYINKFQSILNSIPDMAEADQIEYFLNGLHRSIRRGCYNSRSENTARCNDQGSEAGMF